MLWSFQVFLRQAAITPPRVPITADRTAETPTSATVGRDGGHDLIPHRLAGLIRNPQVELSCLLQIEKELGAEGLVQAKGDPQVLQGLGRDIAPPKQRANGVGLDHAKQEEVEYQDEDQGEQRAQHLAQDEPASPLAATLFAGQASYSRSSAVVERFLMAKKMPPITATPTTTPPIINSVLLESSPPPASIGVRRT